MSRPNSEYMLNKIDKEGFDYAFEGYSDFSEVEDPVFHEYRLAYLKARNDLEEYMKCD
jgi:hypothetical protein